MSNEEEILQMLGIKSELSWGDRYRIRIAKKHIHRAQRVIRRAYYMTQKAKAAIEREEKVIKEIQKKWKK
tara:strand:- start:365 stop:574 length:210 start_codon:yes stop_codon:yes gene_type:complete